MNITSEIHCQLKSEASRVICELNHGKCYEIPMPYICVVECRQADEFMKLLKHYMSFMRERFGGRVLGARWEIISSEIDPLQTCGRFVLTVLSGSYQEDISAASPVGSWIKEESHKLK